LGSKPLLYCRRFQALKLEKIKHKEGTNIQERERKISPFY